MNYLWNWEHIQSSKHFVLISYAHVIPAYTVITIRLEILNIPWNVYSGAARMFWNLTNEKRRYFV